MKVAPQCHAVTTVHNSDFLVTDSIHSRHCTQETQKPGSTLEFMVNKIIIEFSRFLLLSYCTSVYWTRNQLL